MDDERIAAVAIASGVEPATPGVAELLAEHGAIRALDLLNARRRRGARPVVGRLEPEDVPAMLDRMHRSGVRVVLAGDPEFPSQLMDLGEPPLALWVRGPLDLRASALRSVAVVGSRACTAYGERVAVDLGAGLARRGWAVVSGGAFGIDAAAHRGALGVDGPTVAILASGIDLAYPRAHDGLLARVGDTGLLVSELPPGSEPLRHRFLARNRLIAGLTRGTVVVEAARRSGAMATANRALELGREVMAVPGPVTSMASAGTNRMLHEATARAVSDTDEVVEVLLGGAGEGMIGGADPGGSPAMGDGAVGHEPGPSTEGLPPDATRVLEVLPPRRAVSLEVLASRAGVDEVTCLAVLGILEIRGLARRGGSGWRGC